MLPLVLCLALGINLDQIEWKSLLNANIIYDIASAEDGAWCATNGGVHFFSINDSAFTRHFTNVEGLPHNVCGSIIRLASGELWVGTGDGLALIDPDTDKALLHPELDGGQILSLALNGDTLAVGTPTGVLFILMNSTAGVLDDDIKIPVQSLINRSAPRMCWFHGDLWIGSMEGLRRYIPATQTVEHFSTTGGLLSSKIVDLDAGDSLDVLTSKGVSRYVESSPNFHTVFLLEDTLPRVTSIAHAGDTIYVTASSWETGYKRLFRYREAVDSLDTLGFWINTPAGGKFTWARYMQVIVSDKWGRVWIGLASGNDLWGSGFIVWDANGSQSFDIPGLNSNLAQSLLLDNGGNLWVSHWQIHLEKGVTRYSDDGWVNLYDNDTTLINTSTRAMVVDSKGRIAFGSYWSSSGVIRYDPSTEQWEDFTWERSDPNIIEWVAVDPLDRIWVAHFGTNELISVLSSDFSGVVAEIPWTYGALYSMQFDASGTVWIACVNGLIAYRVDDFADGAGQGEFFDEVYGQPVWDIVLDGTGGVWGATSSGAFHWTEDETTWYDESSPLPEEDIVSVDRDPWGRIWFLCRNQGVVVYDPAAVAYDTSKALWQRIYSYNSPLISGFAYTWLDADRTGRVAVGTSGGGVSLFTLPSYTDSTVTTVSVYPNPCYTSHGLPVRFTPVDGAESVTVYTISGERVREITPEEFLTIQGAAQAELDVQHLASGLYLAVIRFPTRVERVKFVLLR